LLHPTAQFLSSLHHTLMLVSVIIVIIYKLLYVTWFCKRRQLNSHLDEYANLWLHIIVKQSYNHYNPLSPIKFTA